MRLLSLSLEHFRTYPSLEVDLSGGQLHVFLGPNGIGKTNLLEAVSVLSLTKSCRGVEDDDLRTWNSEFYRVRGTIEQDGGTQQRIEVVSMALPRKKRACFINDVQKTVGEYAGTFPVVCFLPEDLAIFRGPPAERRRFLDQLLCQVSPEYLLALSAYQQALKQRNSLLRMLRKGGDSGDLAPWEQQLAVHGGLLSQMRLELLQTINLTLPDEMARLGERWDAPTLRYLRETQAATATDIALELRDRLREARPRDIELQSTGIGPHREDWELLGGGRSTVHWASRGQERVALLALVLLQVAYLELRRGEKPLIVLDDVCSELDADHQRALLGSLRGHQILLSSTHVPDGLEHIVRWQVVQGGIHPL